MNYVEPRRLRFNMIEDSQASRKRSTYLDRKIRAASGLDSPPAPAQSLPAARKGNCWGAFHHTDKVR
jgi:hypothetical protein